MRSLPGDFANIEPFVRGAVQNRSPVSISFADLGVSADLIDALDKRRITEPFPIQAAAIPDALAGRDISGRAPTGSARRSRSGSR